MKTGTSLGPKRSSSGLWIIESITRIVLLKGDVNLTFKQDNPYSGAYQLDLDAQPLATGIPALVSSDLLRCRSRFRCRLVA